MRVRRPMRKVQQPREGLSCKRGADCVISRTVISSMQRACTRKVPGFNTDYTAPCSTFTILHSLNIRALHCTAHSIAACISNLRPLHWYWPASKFSNWRETKGESCPAWCVLCAMYTRAGRRNLAKLPPVANYGWLWVRFYCVQSTAERGHGSTTAPLIAMGEISVGCPSNSCQKLARREVYNVKESTRPHYFLSALLARGRQSTDLSLAGWSHI